MNHTFSLNLARPTAGVLEWLQELFDLMNNNRAFRGDDTALEKIAEALGIDATSLVSIAARTPQKSSLKLFRLLYPTTGSRGKCRSISEVPGEQLQNIYREFCYTLLNHRGFVFFI
jgi:hypothetical protein